MGKKRIRKTQTSKGQRRNIVAGVKEVRRDVPELTKAINKLEAWKKGQNPWITVPGTQTNMRFVKVRANSLWGDPKKIASGLFSKVAGDE